MSAPAPRRTCDDSAQACEERRRVCGEARVCRSPPLLRSRLPDEHRTATDGRHSGASQPAAAGAAPPHSIEAEQSVLGAMLLSDRTHYAFVIEEGLKVEDFYRERHREVYESMLALFPAGESIDVLTVTEHLRSRGRLDAAGGQAEIDALTAAVADVGELRHYGRWSRTARSCGGC